MIDPIHNVLGTHNALKRNTKENQVIITYLCEDLSISDR